VNSKIRGGLLALMAAALAVFADVAPAAAHAGLVLTVNDDGRGNVAVDVIWADGHPVTEPVAGMLTAVSTAGAQVGPAPLTRLPDQSTVVYDGTLKPGSWQVTVDLALPGIGHCAAVVTVAAGGAAAKPGSTRCGDTTPPGPALVAAPETGGGKPPWPLFGAGAIMLATAAAVVVSRRRRRST
jgi:LPXTG-motif cell wall-anchored protein